MQATAGEVEPFLSVVMPHLNEVQRRLVAGAMAESLGRGGKTALAKASGLFAQHRGQGPGRGRGGY